MHQETMDFMVKHLKRYREPTADVLDVGSYKLNWTYRDLVEGKGWKYTGLDIQAGPNVDVVAEDPFHYPFDNNTFDIVISGATMEHVTAIWRWIPELVRILKPGGLLVVVAPHTYHEHRYPFDCWRIMPDGMRYLFELNGQLEDMDIEMGEVDTAGSAFKELQ